MAFNDALAAVRKDRGLTQEQLAAKLYVTRQAVSRWERGEVVPGIDMIKLIATVLDTPITRLLEMPEHYCQSCGMILTPESYGTDAAGNPTDRYCKWCYEDGTYTYETTMDEMIEDCAPRLAKNTGMTPDEAVSLMGAVLPQLERWSAVHSNEKRFGAEARERYGDAAVDAANERLLDMDEATWNDRNALEGAIIDQLKAAMETGDAHGTAAQQLARMHARWISLSWGEGAYTPEAHNGLADGYLADPRFVDYYDSRAGAGATEFLVAAIHANIGSSI